MLVESLTGNTWRAAELIADDLRRRAGRSPASTKLRSRTYAAIQEADIVLVGTWVHGLFVVGQTPWARSTISNLPAMRGKQAAVFCTFALNPGNSLEKLDRRGGGDRRRRGRRAGPQPLQARGAQRGVRRPPHRRHLTRLDPDMDAAAERTTTWAQDAAGSGRSGRPCRAVWRGTQRSSAKSAMPTVPIEGAEGRKDGRRRRAPPSRGAVSVLLSRGRPPAGVSPAAS